MPKVWNKRDPNVPKDAVYVGRPTKWGNPFSHQDGTLARFKVASRDIAVEAFRDMVWEDDAFQNEIIEELRGKDLVCWCAPRKCHADVLLEIANSDAETGLV